MKHTFVLIDNLMILIGKIPAQLRSDDDLGKVRKILDKILEYNWKLGKLIGAHQTQEHLMKLLACHDTTIPDWAARVDAQFKKLDALMKVLYEDVPKLKRILEDGVTRQNEINSNAWANKVGDMALGIIMAGFHHAEHNMAEFRRAEIFEKKHLLELLEDLSAMEELLE